MRRERGKTRVLGLFSGGLDSRLAVRLLQEQNLEVSCVHFRTGFVKDERREVVEQTLRSPSVRLEVVDVREDYLSLVREPRLGYGSGMNPCLDCRILMLAKDLGRVNFFSEEKERELLELKKNWGWSDPRNTKEFENCDICANDIFRDSWQAAGVERRAFDAPPSMGPSSSAAAPSPPAATGDSQEAMIQAITDRVVAELARR